MKRGRITANMGIIHRDIMTGDGHGLHIVVMFGQIQGVHIVVTLDVILMKRDVRGRHGGMIRANL